MTMKAITSNLIVRWQNDKSYGEHRLDTQGIGKQLLNAVKDYSKDKGLAGIVLYTSEYAPAAKFYEKNGFKLSKGTICMYYE